MRSQSRMLRRGGGGHKADCQDNRARGRRWDWRASPTRECQFPPAGTGNNSRADAPRLFEIPRSAVFAVAHFSCSQPRCNGPAALRPSFDQANRVPPVFIFCEQRNRLVKKAGAGEIVREIERGLQVAAEIFSPFKYRAHQSSGSSASVSRSSASGFAGDLILRSTMTLRLRARRLSVFETQGTVQCSSAVVQSFPAAINFGQGVIAGRRPGLIPGGFVKGVVSLVVAVQMTQAQAEIVIGLAVGRDSRCGGSAARWRGGNVFPRWRIRRAADATGRAHCCSANRRVAAQRLAPVESRASAWRGDIVPDAGR